MYLKLDFQFPACELASVVYGLCAPPSGQIYMDGIIYRTTLKFRTHYLIYKLTTIWMKSHHGRTQEFSFSPGAWGSSRTWCGHPRGNSSKLSAFSIWLESAVHPAPAYDNGRAQQQHSSNQPRAGSHSRLLQKVLFTPLWKR